MRTGETFISNIYYSEVIRGLLPDRIPRRSGTHPARSSGILAVDVRHGHREAARGADS